MNNPYSLPNNTTLTSEGGFLFNDWELSERRTTEEMPPFDGKIIARMPDLGAEGLLKSIEKPKFPSFWERTYSSVLATFQGTISSSTATRQQFFHRFTTIGCVVLLCGVGILLLERGNKSAETAFDIGEFTMSDSAEATTTPPPFITGIGHSDNESAFAPIVPPWSNDTPSDVAPHSAIPVAPMESFAAVPNTAVDPPEPAGSVWERPVADSYSPWGIASRQPEIPQTGVIPSTVAMSPMLDMSSMPMSPYEQQLLAQSNLPVQPPVDPFMQVNNQVVPGMMPMQERMKNTSGVATTQNNVRRGVAPPLHPQYVPQSAVQDMHAPFSQQVPPPVPPNMPIPSAVSTLQPQGSGYYPPPPNTSVPGGQPTDFYGTPYRRVY